MRLIQQMDFRFFPALLLLVVALPLSAAPGKPGARAAGRADKKPAVDLFAEAKDKVLRWQFAEGDILELKKFSDQVVRTGASSVKRSVFHRVLLEARKPDPAKGFPLEGTFTTLIKSGETKNVYAEAEKYTASFVLQPAGQFVADADQYMPNIRSVPSFSESRDPALKEEAGMEPGTTWEKPGAEVMRFDKLVNVPFNVRYEYRGLENVKSEEGEKSCHKFISNYELNYGDNNGTGPRVFGYVTAIWFWDAAQGIPYYAQEDYNVIIVNEQGLANEFKIKSRSYYRKFRARGDEAKVALAQKIKEDLVKDNPQLDVRVTDHGVAIALPDVFFATDSAKLSSDAKKVIERVGKTLRSLQNRHIRVRGHTDSTGDEKYNQQLSEKRAESVADYLIDEAELNPDSVSYDGRGARDPVADNSLEEGRARNRRVEIILLDR
ncbi:MAG TPA: OmpA family protein [Turneriella sp.]|nr:OmpA family protein [Turneriella sp.]